MSTILNIVLSEIEVRENMREHDPLAISELADSIQETGLIQPITVMEQPEAEMPYRLIAGHRRLEAFALLKLKEIPALIRGKMTEEEILTLQLVENIQRETVSVIEECRSFTRLVQEKHYTPVQIARMVGKSQVYVDRRLMCNNLHPDATVLVHVGKLNIEHAYLLSQCRPDTQLILLDRIKDNSTPQGNFLGPGPLKALIRQIVVHPLGIAPFSFTDEQLFPEAGSCSGCAKRTGSDTRLFETIESDDDCLDPECYQAKVRRYMESMTEKYKGMPIHFLTDRWYPEPQLKKKGLEFSSFIHLFDMAKGKPKKGYPLKEVGVWIECTEDPHKNGTVVQVFTKEQHTRINEEQARVPAAADKGKRSGGIEPENTTDQFEKNLTHIKKYIRSIINDIALNVSKQEKIKIPESMLRMIGHELIQGLDDVDLRLFLRNFGWAVEYTGPAGEPVLINHENAVWANIERLYAANIYRYSGRDLNELIIYMMLLELGSRAVGNNTISKDFIYAIETAQELGVDVETPMKEMEKEAGIDLKKYFIQQP